MRHLGLYCNIYHNTQVKCVLYWNISEWKKLGRQWCEIKGKARGASQFKIQGGPCRKMIQNLSLQNWDKQICSESDGDMIHIASCTKEANWSLDKEVWDAYRTWELPLISWMSSQTPVSVFWVPNMYAKCQWVSDSKMLGMHMTS